MVDGVLQLGQGAWISKLDLKDAFKIIPVHPSDIPLLGIRWRGLYFVAQWMVFGLRSAARIFNNFSTALAWIIFDWAKKRPIPSHLCTETGNISQLFVSDLMKFRHLLDDFIVLSNLNHKLALLIFKEIVQTFQNYGFPLNFKKLFEPALCQIVFGIGINTRELCFYVSDNKADQNLILNQ